MSSPLCVSSSEFKGDHSNALSYLSHVIRSPNQKSFTPFFCSNKMCAVETFCGTDDVINDWLYWRHLSTCATARLPSSSFEQMLTVRISSIYSSFCLFTCDDAEQEEALDVLLSSLRTRRHSTVSNLENKQMYTAPPIKKRRIEINKRAVTCISIDNVFFSSAFLTSLLMHSSNGRKILHLGNRSPTHMNKEILPHRLQLDDRSKPSVSYQN